LLLLGLRTDLLKPAVPNQFRYEDFVNPTRIRLTGAFFSILFNLSKFTLFEQRDPVIVKQELNEQGITYVHFT
jgi:serine/threonine-protein phosphatase 2A regulatory subunit B''